MWLARPGGDAAAIAPGTEVDLVVRPESLAFAPAGALNALPGEVVERRYAGRVAFFTVRLAASGEAEVLAAPGAAHAGDRLSVRPDPGGPVPHVYVRAKAAP